MSQSIKLVPAVERTGLILDYLAESSKPVSLADLARNLELPKSSVHGLVHTLSAMRLLRAVDGDRYALGPHVLHWANAMLSGTDLVSEFHNVLAENRSLDKFTVTLSDFDQGDVVYLACRNADAPLGLSFRIGMRLPAVFTATGKAILASFNKKELDAVLPKPWPKAMTQQSVRSRKKLEEDLHFAREHGFALDNGQVREDMFCVGAAITNNVGQAVAGIALSMTRSEADEKTIKRLGASVTTIAKNLSAFV